MSLSLASRILLLSRLPFTARSTREARSNRRGTTGLVYSGWWTWGCVREQIEETESMCNGQMIALWPQWTRNRNVRGYAALLKLNTAQDRRRCQGLTSRTFASLEEKQETTLTPRYFYRTLCSGGEIVLQLWRVFSLGNVSFGFVSWSLLCPACT